ncbi:hypothetical protein [Lewinella cohaerens]|uniref:hypothetical protein n=1 Tax=Lewinella cohaerens TaxID=70995 RepID=UPI000380BFFC|nr:hypothetical protein [Lewinella cohaerens]
MRNHYLRNFGYFCILITLCCASCAARYHPIQPETVAFITLPDSLAKQEVTFAYRYHVLKDAGNRKYAKKEKRHGISLLALRIVNDRPDTLLFPEDFYVLGPNGGDSLNILWADMVYDRLLQDKYQKKGNYEVPLGRGFGDAMINNMGLSVKRSTEKKANELFSQELDDFYLVPCYIAPGVSMVGLVGINVERDTYLRFGVKENGHND